MRKTILVVILLVICQAVTLGDAFTRKKTTRKLKSKHHGMRLMKEGGKEDELSVEQQTEEEKPEKTAAEAINNANKMMKDFIQGAKDVDSIAKSGVAFYNKGKKLLKARDIQSQSKKDFILDKVVQSVALADAGIKLIIQNKNFIETISSSTKALSDSGVLSCLGPIGIGVGLGLNILTMGIRLAKGEPLVPPSPADLAL